MSLPQIWCSLSLTGPVTILILITETSHPPDDSRAATLFPSSGDRVQGAAERQSQGAERELTSLGLGGSQAAAGAFWCQLLLELCPPCSSGSSVSSTWLPLGLHLPPQNHEDFRASRVWCGFAAGTCPRVGA